ncbi:unnamed protein product [Ixodes hexagonus]
MARHGSDPGAVLQELLKAASGELLINTLKSVSSVLSTSPDTVSVSGSGVSSVAQMPSPVFPPTVLRFLQPLTPVGHHALGLYKAVPLMKLNIRVQSADFAHGSHCVDAVRTPRCPNFGSRAWQAWSAQAEVGYSLANGPTGLVSSVRAAPLSAGPFVVEPGADPRPPFFERLERVSRSLPSRRLLPFPLCPSLALVLHKMSVPQGVLRLMKLFPSDPGKTRQTSLPRITHLFLFDRAITFSEVTFWRQSYEYILFSFRMRGEGSGHVVQGRQLSGPMSIRLPQHSQLRGERIRRDCPHFGLVNRLSKSFADKAYCVSSQVAERHGMSIGDMKRFVANELKSLQQQHNSLALYIGSCEVIKSSQTNFEGQLRTEHNLLEGLEVREGTNFIEECIHRQYPSMSVLRLLCLLSLTQDGIPARELRSFTQQFLHSFGAHHLWSFHGLRKLGLCVEQGGGASGGLAPSPLGVASSAPTLASKVAAAMAALPRGTRFSAITRRLNLIPPNAGDNYDLKSPKDPGYVFSGAYVPVACRLVEQIMQREGVHGYEDALKLLPGPTSTFTLPHSKGSSREPPGLVVVYFLGGVTFAEVSALRLLARLKGFQILVAATATVNGNTLLENVVPKQP